MKVYRNRETNIHSLSNLLWHSFEVYAMQNYCFIFFGKIDYAFIIDAIPNF